LETFFENELASLKERGLLRDLYMLPHTGGEITVNGKKLVNFSSNDYLDLARDERLKDAAIRTVEELGCGATAARLMTGHLELHEQLEADLAQMMGTDEALVFGSGFLTNLGVLTALAKADDEVYADKLNHASLIDGIRLSRAHSVRYQHKDLDHLEGLLKKSKTKGKRIIVSDSVFSMDGDIAPLAGLAQLAYRYEALMVIDEAHAIGVMGENGGGVCRIKGEEVRPDIIIGTLSKSLGGYGGYAASSTSIRRFLINNARSFIYSTGLPPACVSSGRESVSILKSDPGLGKALLDKARYFRNLLADAGLNVPEFESQIIPILVGDNEKAVHFSQMLWDQGLLIKAIRPPTVPIGTSRVRLSITLALTDEVLSKSADMIAQMAKKVGIIT
jgi:8-amino-7-oxononanoate synthase